MPPLGAHQSIAGGYYRAVQRAREAGCDCVQLFTRNCSRWAAKPITLDEAARFRQTLSATGVSHPLAHDSYLINLASPDRILWNRSVDSLAEELRRADLLGIPYVVAHPGAATDGTEAAGLKRIVRAIDKVHAEACKISAGCLLETTAGQGTALGWRFEHLAAILEAVGHPERLGVCFDTCHVFAAGYPLGTRREYEATMHEFDQIVGLDRIKAFHINDCRCLLGGRVDRHAPIGRGEIGLSAFRHLVNDPRFSHVPMYLETPKGTENGESFDVINLRLLRSLAEAPLSRLRRAPRSGRGRG